MSEQKSKQQGFSLEVYLLILLIIQVLLLGLVLFKLTQLETHLLKNDAATNPTNNIIIDDVSFGFLPPIGMPNAKVQIVAFIDYQCPYCAQTTEIFNNLLNKYPNQIQIHIRNFPLDGHPLAKKAATAAYCANEQGKFWEYHDLLFSNQKTLTDDSFLRLAEEINLNSELFLKCQNSEDSLQTINQDMKDANTYGISGTPATIINGEMIFGADAEKINLLVDRKLKEMP